MADPRHQGHVCLIPTRYYRVLQFNLFDSNKSNSMETTEIIILAVLLTILPAHSSAHAPPAYLCLLGQKLSICAIVMESQIFVNIFVSSF